ncbi:MAG: hypothetical protein KDD64_03710 [Bdellovibrionales bacterium]|nr:hypothetical protein [Bdellovibrionales bacterium]
MRTLLCSALLALGLVVQVSASSGGSTVGRSLIVHTDVPELPPFEVDFNHESPEGRLETTLYYNGDKMFAVHQVFDDQGNEILFAERELQTSLNGNRIVFRTFTESADEKPLLEGELALMGSGVVRLDLTVPMMYPVQGMQPGSFRFDYNVESESILGSGRCECPRINGSICEKRDCDLDPPAKCTDNKRCKWKEYDPAKDENLVVSPESTSAAFLQILIGTPLS